MIPASRAVYLQTLRSAALAKGYVSLGSRRTATPHEFYRYPARFPPAFARAAIEAFTLPGDLVLDPFAGGGTTLVEARLAGRPAVGSDLNPLAVFVSSVKTKPLSPSQLSAVRDWSLTLPTVSDDRPISIDHWDDAGYFRNLEDPDAVAVRDYLARCVDSLSSVPTAPAAALARCAVLRTGQWALDMRSEVPAVEAVAQSLTAVSTAMIDASARYTVLVKEADQSYDLPAGARRTRVIEQAVPGLADRLVGKIPPPKLVLTSPPYPGVYVNYHRWKVRGRRETPAPYWLADRRDGHGIAHYTMAARSDRTLRTYFQKLEDGFSDIAAVCDRSTVAVQIVGFHNPAEELPRYLAAMSNAGFDEVRLPMLANSEDGRLWRQVPNRRWWAINSPEFQTAAEVVLLHVLS